MSETKIPDIDFLTQSLVNILSMRVFAVFEKRFGFVITGERTVTLNCLKKYQSPSSSSSS